MLKSYEKIMSTAAVALGALTIPLLNFGAGATTWGLQLTALVLLALLVAAMNMQWREKWLLVAAAILAVIGSSANWMLLPLAAAQVLLALLVTTQAMPAPLRATAMIGQAAFLQVLLTMAGSQILSHSFLLQLLFTAIPFIVASWSGKMPIWLTAVLVVGLAVAGYFTQTLTLLVALVIIILALLPIRSADRMPAWYWAIAFPIAQVVLQLSLLHG
ncbi:hypothetical protein [Lacticaseibacillus hulanensis]|uniref:hypothetical protein n=1 Tax=Lacticaseibacillus hulanensis TaxID=2493111 RepID=UPI000FD9A2D3|nr:hypothetical protein [Lacticaseibacillus hulanensis]